MEDAKVCPGQNVTFHLFTMDTIMTPVLMWTMAECLGATPMFPVLFGRIVIFSLVPSNMVRINLYYFSSNDVIKYTGISSLIFILNVISDYRKNETHVSFVLPTIMRILRELFENSAMEGKLTN